MYREIMKFRQWSLKSDPKTTVKCDNNREADVAEIWNNYSRTSVARTLMLVYDGYFELILESLTKDPIAANIIVFGIISGDFILIMVCYVY